MVTINLSKEEGIVGHITESAKQLHVVGREHGDQAERAPWPPWFSLY